MFTNQEGPINPLGLFEKPSILVVLINLLPPQNKLQPNQYIDKKQTHNPTTLMRGFTQ
jgi:hypothetical protein